MVGASHDQADAQMFPNLSNLFQFGQTTENDSKNLQS
jgi:hypothetical protein